MIRIKASSLVLHMVAWLLFLSFPLLFMTQGKPFGQLHTDTAYAYLSFCGLYMVIFYLNTEVLLPVFFFKQKYFSYALLLLLLFLAVFFIKPFDNLVGKNQNRHPQSGFNRPGPENGSLQQEFGPPPGNEQRLGPPPDDGQRPVPPPERRGFEPGRQPARFDITSAFIFLMVIGIGTAFQSVKQSSLFEKRAVQAEADKTNAELSFLKAQINPHFLYNTLNNIYTLCITGSDQAAESILMLSGIMRYVTDESGEDFVPLKDELDCIGNFIALQKLRLGKKTTLRYTIEGNPELHRIPPLILMTFVENVFKYGLSNHLEAEIDISLQLSKGKISFQTRNQVFGHKKQENRKGVGLDNTQKRLSRLYPGSHTLAIHEDASHFTVLLVLDSK